MQYEYFMNMYKSKKPYRGTNEIPYADRTMRPRFFKARQSGDELVFDMYDGDELGTLYPDNTFEFTNNLWTSQLYTMNNYLFRSSHLPYIGHSSKHGGVVLRKWSEKIVIPVFKGLRINLETLELHENSKYEVRIKKLNTKDVNKGFKVYEEKFKLAQAILKSMPCDIFVNDLTDFMNSSPNLKNSMSTDEFLNEMLTTNDPVSLIYRVSYNDGIKGVHRIHEWNTWWGKRPDEYRAVDYYNEVRKRIRTKFAEMKGMYKEDIHSWESKYYPSGSYTISFYVNGVERKSV